MKAIWFRPTYCCVLLYSLIMFFILICVIVLFYCVLLTAVCYCTICFYPTYCCVLLYNLFPSYLLLCAIAQFDSVLLTAVCYCTIRLCSTSYTLRPGWLLCRADKAGLGGDHSPKRSAGKHNDCYVVRIRRGYEKRTVQNVVQQENTLLRRADKTGLGGKCSPKRCSAEKQQTTSVGSLRKNHMI